MYRELVEELSTPCRYGPILEPTGRAGDFDSEMVDCPFVFRHDGRWWMTYVGFDGRGYRTGLARSDDLFHWERCGLILDWGSDDSFDRRGAAGLWILRDPRLDSPVLMRYQGRFWMFYGAYDGEGYEAGVGRIGLAWSDGDLMRWHKVEWNPILDITTADVGLWERDTLYKPSCIYHDGRFWLFYNAKGLVRGQIREQTGLAWSYDLRSWHRYEENPVLTVGDEGEWDSLFCSDPFICWYKDKWLMFYYGYDGKHAQDGLAFSNDLTNWEKWPQPILPVGTPGAADSLHAHKPCIILHEGVVYHFYCAVRDVDGRRTIALATSGPRKMPNGVSKPLRERN